MSIIKAIDIAHRKAEDRGWDRIYFAIDVHDTILKANYDNGGYSFINDSARYAMQMLSRRSDIRIILWSSMYSYEMNSLIAWLASNDIHIDFANENPDEPDTTYACFARKFYFSVLIDDKAGFDPSCDWDQIIQYYKLRDRHVFN